MRTSSFARVAVAGMVAAILPTLPMPAANAVASNPGYTLEGCQQDGPHAGHVTFPANGPFICPDNAYTTGNLAKGWNELDLVPHRVTLAKPNAGTFTLGLGGDHLEVQGGTAIGWDFVSVPVLNTAKSGTNCPSVTDLGLTFPVNSNGGAYDSIQRNISFSSSANASADCVYDYYQRLAVGASQYSGSSLQSYINSSYSGEKRISLPVREVLPQTITKEMTATQNAEYVWSLTKEANPTRLTLTNTCETSTGQTGSVQITVSWQRLAATPTGDITVVTTVNAQNPAARDVTVSVVDVLKSGTTTLQTHTFADKVIPAGSDTLVGTWVTTVPSGTTALNDIATATYIDTVTGVPVQNNTTATDTATVSTGTTTNATAVVTDSESISGTGLSFSVDSTTGTSGTFTLGGNPYVLGTHTTGPVLWTSGTQSGDGSVVYNKTVYADFGTATSNGLLSDTATLTKADNTTLTASASTAITSTTLGTITVTKTAPAEFQGSDTASFTVRLATGTTFALANQVASHVFTFTSSTPVVGGVATLSYTFTGLAAGNYVVHEDAVTGWQPQDDQVVPLSGATVCSNSVTFNNEHGPAVASAKKVTVPAGSEAGWAFQLTRNGVAYDSGTTNASGNLIWLSSGTTTIALDEGSYVFTETPQAGWDQTGASGCTFTVNYPADADKTFTCTFTNTRRGHIVVYKHTDPAGSTQAFGFTANYDADGFSLTDGQSDDSGLLVPGAYNVAETGVTGWDLISATCTDVAGHPYAPSAITLLPGETVTCHFTNRQRGHVRIVKTFNGAALSGTDSFTFQLRSGASTVSAGTILESGTANAGNGGVVNFATYLVPGTTYQICEIGIPVNWHSTLSDLTGAFTPAPGDNSTVCVPFTVSPGETKTFTVNNVHPGGEARTIGYWKNWASCKTSGGKQAPVLDRTLAASEPNGITIGTLVLHGSTSTPNQAPSCQAAVRILNKSRVDTGAKQASDPAFGLAAQLLAAKLNIIAGASTCAAANTAISQASALLLAIHFNGSTHDVMTAAQKTQANSLASTLDRYNNNTLC